MNIYKYRFTNKQSREHMGESESKRYSFQKIFDIFPDEAKNNHYMKYSLCLMSLLLSNNAVSSLIKYFTVDETKDPV